MVFSSISFIYIFLPVALLLYFMVPRRLKNLVLLLVSLFFYYYGEPVYYKVMTVSALAGYGFGFPVQATRKTGAGRVILWAAVICCLAPLLFFKYSDFFIANVNAVFNSDIRLMGLALPIGISFYTFQILSYIIDVYRGEAQVQKNPISFTAYVILFPQLIAGPIVRYQTVQDELNNRRHSLEAFASGVTQFCIGLGKKVILANSLAESGAALSAADSSVLSCWIWAIFYTFQIYFDFSGYSDMAIGLGKMFGFHFPMNFNYPYISGSITEFWRRWHISLGSWFRDYVYIPLGGNRCSKPRWFINILVVWFLTGFWHGAAWNFIFWGLYFAIFLLVEKLFLQNVLKKLPGIMRTVYVMFFVIISFVLFNADSMGEAFGNIKNMFGAGSLPVSDAAAVYYLRSSIILLIIATVGSTPLPKGLIKKLSEYGKGNAVVSVLEPLFCVAVLLIVTAYLIDGSFNPFLYFRF